MENTSNKFPAVPFAEVRDMATAIAASGLYGVKRPEQALALMLVAQAEGRHPAIAARDYHVIEGRPALKADAMLARFQEAGGCIKWIELTDTCAKAEFSHPKGGSLVLDWTIERAKAAGLAGRDTWRRYPRSMLKSRLISDGIRAVYPAAICGTYTPDESEEIAERERSVRPVPVEVVDGPVGTSANGCEAVSAAPEPVAPRRGKRSQSALLKAAAEKANGKKAEAVEVEPVPAEPATDPAQANAEAVEADRISVWLDGARTLAANGTTAPELKADALKFFNGDLPADVKSFLLDVWNRSREQAPEPIPEPGPDGVEPLPY